MSKQLTSTKGRVPTGFADEIVISESTFRAAHREVEGAGASGRKRKREEKGDSSVVYGAGAYKGPWARYEEEQPDTSGSEEEVEVEYEEDEIAPQPAAPSKVGTAYQETSDAKEFTPGPDENNRPRHAKRSLVDTAAGSDVLASAVGGYSPAGKFGLK